MEKQNIKKILNRINDIETIIKIFVGVGAAVEVIIMAQIFFIGLKYGPNDVPMIAIKVLTVINIAFSLIIISYNAGKRSELKDYLQENYDK